MNLKALFSKKTISLSSDKKQQTLVGVFVVLIVITLIFLYYNFWRSTPSVYIDAPGAGPEVRLERVLEKVDFDAGYLKATRFQDLNFYGNWPLEMPEPGRPNPFSF